MKLSKEVLVEIVGIVATGLAEGKDISQELRELDLYPAVDELVLSSEYLASHPRNQEVV